MSHNFLLIILFTLLSLSCTQNIITAWHYDKVLMYIYKNIQNYFQEDLLEFIKEIKIEPKEEGDIKILEIKPTSVSLTTIDSYGNLNSCLFLFTPYKLNLNFDVKYHYNEKDLNAQLELNVNELKFNVNSTNKNKIKMNDKDYIVYEVDKSILTNFTNLIIKIFNENEIMTKISNKINIRSYYEKIMKNHRNFIYESSNVLGNKIIEISLNRFIDFCKEVDLKFENAICYFSGEVNGDDKEDKKNVVLSITNFTEANDNYHMFINYKLFNDVMSKMINEGIKNNFKNGSVSKALDYNFTSKYIKEVFEFKIESDNITFNVDVEIIDFHFNSNGKGNATLNNTINIEGHSEKIIFSFSFEFNSEAKIVKNTKINICFSNVKVNNVISSTNIKDENKLKSWIENSFEPSHLCLSNNGITLRDYFSYMEEIKSEEKGIFIKGMHLYQ